MSDDLVERLKIMARWINADGRYPTPTPVFAAQCAVDALAEIEWLQDVILEMGLAPETIPRDDGKSISNEQGGNE